VDSSRRLHEAAQEQQVRREPGGCGTVSMEVGVTTFGRITESDS